MLAELILLQQVLDGTDNNRSNDTSNAVGKAQAAYDDYIDKVNNYLDRINPFKKK